MFVKQYKMGISYVLDVKTEMKSLTYKTNARILNYDLAIMVSYKLPLLTDYSIELRIQLFTNGKISLIYLGTTRSLHINLSPDANLHKYNHCILGSHPLFLSYAYG